MEYDPLDYYQAIDNDFNRANNPNEIGKYYRSTPPSNIAVKVLDASERVKARNYFDALERKAKEERFNKLKEFRINRTWMALEEALDIADCKLFTEIVHWAIQKPPYLSIATLCNRIKELETYERRAGIIPKELTNRNYETTK